MGWEVEMGIPGRGTAGAKCWRWGNEGACRQGVGGAQAQVGNQSPVGKGLSAVLRSSDSIL